MKIEKERNEVHVIENEKGEIRIALDPKAKKAFVYNNGISLTLEIKASEKIEDVIKRLSSEEAKELYEEVREDIHDFVLDIEKTVDKIVVKMHESEIAKIGEIEVDRETIIKELSDYGLVTSRLLVKVWADVFETHIDDGLLGCIEEVIQNGDYADCLEFRLDRVKKSEIKEVNEIIDLYLEEEKKKEIYKQKIVEYVERMNLTEKQYDDGVYYEAYFLTTENHLVELLSYKIDAITLQISSDMEKARIVKASGRKKELSVKEFVECLESMLKISKQLAF